MTLLRHENTDEFNAVIAALNNELAVEGNLNLLSQAVHAEESFKRILNSLYGWNLENANEGTQNAEGVDLIDRDNRLVVQVSISCTKEKINQTLKKTIMKQYANAGYRLKFAFVGKQDSAVKTKSYKNENQIEFDPASDIILSVDLARRFMHLDIESQERALHVARQETGADFMLTREVLSDLFESSKGELGARYIPDLTVTTVEMDYYEPLIHPIQVKDSIVSLSAGVVANLKKIDIKTLAEKEPEDCTQSGIEDLAAFLDSVEVLSHGRECVTAENISTALVCANSILYSGSVAHGETDKSDDIAAAIKEIQHQAVTFDRKMANAGYGLLDRKFVIVNGNGGIGKSHFIADLCAKANASDTPAILFLGQNFIEGEAPLHQMAQRVAPNLSGEAFLEEVSRFAHARSARGIIAIDALNEGVGRRFWVNHLHALKEKIDGYDNLLLIVSVRSPYEKDVIPESLYGFLDSSCIHLDGFSYCDNAVEAFCSYYGIDVPAVPFLDEEFRNPLYLRMLCEAAKVRGANTFDLRMSFSDAIGIVVANVSKILAGENRLGYDRHINFVDIALRTIASESSFIERGWIKYETAFDLVTEAVAGRIDRPGDLLGAMCDEDLLRVQEGHGESYLSFAFERVGDFFAAGEILRKVGVCSEKLLADDARAKLKNVVESGLRSGVLEALAILLPERHGVELFEFCNDDLCSEMARCFIESIPWRRTARLSEGTVSFIEQFILKDGELSILFVSRLLDVSLWPDNGINASYMHELLLGMNPQARDALWSWVMLRNGRIERTINWVWRNAKRIPHQSIELAELLLGWCTSTSCRQIRDTATKALSCCLIEDPAGGSRLIHAFSGCGDDYVLERVIAAIYGAAVNSRICETWIAAACGAYELTYGGTEAYPNIMIRNYADCLVTYLASKSVIDINAFPKVLHAGSSSWYQRRITNADIDEELSLTEKRYGKDSDEFHNLWWIIHSMTTEYGRGTGAYGDFGRYVFGGYVGCWTNQFESDQDLSNLVTWEIIEHRYVPELHCSFDRAVNYYERGRGRGFERLSKKYQWIETHRLIARLVDNYPPYRETKTYDREYKEYESKRAKAFHEAFEQASGFPLDFRYEPELEPSDHVLNVLKTSLEDYEVFDELSYVRDVDPTFIFPEVSGAINDSEEIAPVLATLSGVQDYGESNLKDVLSNCDRVMRNDHEFFSLALVVTKKDTLSGTEEVHLNSGSGFIRVEDIQNFLRNYSGKTGSDVLSPSPYAVYASEYCSGFGYRFYKALRSSELDEEKSLVDPASYEYVWEPPRDGSLDGNVARLLAPSQDFIEYYDLTQLPVGTWVDKDGSVICFTECTQEGYQMLVDSKSLVDFLTSKRLLLVQGRYFEISSHDECQRVWLVSYGAGASKRCDRLIDKEKYKKVPSFFDHLRG